MSFAAALIAVSAFADSVPRAEVPGLRAARLPLDTVRDVYPEILFHEGRFRRLLGYRHLRATECLAEIEPDRDVAWFARYLPGDLLLGDAGARDAGIHAVQACIPEAGAKLSERRKHMY